MLADWDDFISQIKQNVRSEMGEVFWATWGYIATYDASSATITAVVPAFRAPDPVAGQLIAQVIGPIQLGTAWAGNGGSWGLQVAPLGGATPANPSAGEQVLITFLGRDTRISVGAVMFFNNVSPPPGGLNPGEAIVKHKSGSFLYFDQSGNVNVNAHAGNGSIVLNGGGTPVAVEGSSVTHDHTLATFTSALSTTVSGIGPPGTPLTNTSLATAISGMTGTATDTAGQGGTTSSKVDAGQGAQDVKAPSPGGN